MIAPRFNVGSIATFSNKPRRGDRGSFPNARLARASSTQRLRNDHAKIARLERRGSMEIPCRVLCRPYRAFRQLLWTAHPALKRGAIIGLPCRDIARCLFVLGLLSYSQPAPST
jgi:hypothetical protein